MAVSYPHIANLLSSKGVPALETSGSSMKYTLPAVTLHYADGTEKTDMDSVAIAPLLEELAPPSASRPSLFPAGEDGAETKTVMQRVQAVLQAAFGDKQFLLDVIAWMPLVLDSRGAVYSTRPARKCSAARWIVFEKSSRMTISLQ